MTALSTTPATFATTCVTAAPGDVIQLTPGVYDPPVLMNRKGLTIRGGKGARFKGAGDKYGANVRNCSDIAFENCVFDGFSRGLLFGLSSNVRASGCEFLHFTSDAIDIGNCWGVVIEDCVIHSAMVDLSTGVHPDGVQFWSRPFDPNTREPWKPCSDLTIRRNTIIIYPGQGICQTNHVRDWPAKGAFPVLKGVDDGGADNVSITDNRVWGGGRACSATAVRGLTFQNNHVSTLPQSENQALYTYAGSQNVTASGNVMDAAPWLGKKGAHD